MQRIQYLGSDARHEMWAEKRKVKKPRNWRSISGKSRFQTRWKREITFGKRKKERIERKSRGDRRMRDKAQRFVEFWKVRTWAPSWEGKDHVKNVKRGNYELQRGEHHTRPKTRDYFVNDPLCALLGDGVGTKQRDRYTDISVQREGHAVWVNGRLPKLRRIHL